VAVADVALPAAGPLFLGDRQLADHERLADLGLLDGMILGVDGPGPTLADPRREGLEIRVTSGPDAGRVLPLSPGSNVAIGRADDAHLRLADPYLGRAHAQVQIDAVGACRLVNLKAPDETLLEGRPTPAGDAVDLPIGSLVETGASQWMVAEVRAPDAALTTDDTGSVTLNRGPRIPPRAPDPVVIDWPAEPEDRSDDKPPIPWVAIVAPLVAAVIMAKLAGDARFLLFAAMSPVLIIGNMSSDRGRRSRLGRKEQSRYAAKLVRAEASLEAAMRDQVVTRRRNDPDPAELLLTMIGPRAKLWERRPADTDNLCLRVGTTSAPAEITFAGSGQAPQDDRRVLRGVPLSLPLETIGVLGVAGPIAASRAVARGLMLQCIARHSPDDVRILLLTDPASERDWKWLAWAPHAATADGDGSAIGNTRETADARIKQLTALITARESLATERAGAIEVPLPRIVVVLDGAGLLRRQAAVPQILLRGPAVGVYAICLDAAENLLPEECGGAILLDEAPAGSVTATVAWAGHNPVEGVLLDQLAPELVEAGARRTTPIRRISGSDATAGLPDSLRLLDLLDLEPPDPARLARGWRTATPTTNAVIGRTVDGLAEIDIKAQGPHGVVAGTTGAGKSQFLLSLIASLAVANRPEDLNFILVDYKGGAAFKDCAALPHTVGVVTDLEGHLTKRVRLSLEAEIATRKVILDSVGASEIDEYAAKAARSGGDHPPLPRLLLVFDEFAELVTEAPEFVDALMRVARVGRTLGMHLILATQTPGGGVVTAQIRANAPLSVGLRVRDTSESDLVISAPDAAWISRHHPGRAYVRVGTEPLVLIQSARIAGPRPAAFTEVTAPRVVVRRWEDLGLEVPDAPKAEMASAGAGPQPEEQEPAPIETDLTVLVKAMVEAWGSSEHAESRRPWLPPLPDRLLLDGLADQSEPPTASWLIPFGLEDFPAEQRQSPACWDLEQGHLIVAGGARTGRSTLLRTLAISTMRQLGADRTNLYVFDCGNGALVRLSNAASCGAVIQRHEPDRAARLIGRLLDEVADRQGRFAANGWTSIAEQWSATDRADHLPYQVVLIDRWEGFVDAFSEVADEAAMKGLLQLLAEGASVGVVVAIAGDRTVLAGRLSALVEQRFTFKLTESDDYSGAGLNARDLPSTILAGQAFRSVTGTEVRVAVLDTNLSGPAQLAALDAAIAASAPSVEVPAHQLPLSVDALPTSIGLEAALDLPAEAPSPFSALLGVGGDRLDATWVDLSAPTSGIAVLGPPKMGRSTALATYARSVIWAGGAVALVGPGGTPLRSLDDDPGVVGRFDGPGHPDLATLLASHPGPLAIIVDDALGFEQEDEVLIDVATARRPDRRLLVAAVTDDADNLYGPSFVSSALKGGSVLLLSPKTHFQGAPFGISLARGSAFSGPPGRGYLRSGGEPVLVQVPLTS
jgi:S-DNA-T family DNA segregation ATPase FtsK/SpoIIIE